LIHFRVNRFVYFQIVFKSLPGKKRKQNEKNKTQENKNAERWRVTCSFALKKFFCQESGIKKQIFEGVEETGIEGKEIPHEVVNNETKRTVKFGYFLPAVGAEMPPEFKFAIQAFTCFKFFNGYPVSVPV
jgi:hypothetical protein